MTRKAEERPLQKVTLLLYEGDFGRLRKLKPALGASKVVRLLVRKYIQNAGARKSYLYRGPKTQPEVLRDTVIDNRSQLDQKDETRPKKPCRYCEQGNPPENGEHWIVKSIIPAQIDIRKCISG